MVSGRDPEKFEREYHALRNGIRREALLERDEANRPQAAQWLMGRFKGSSVNNATTTP
jgi:hypothetical protein